MVKPAGAKGDGKPSGRAPSPREFAAYRNLIQFLSEHGREPTADEAFPWVCEMKRFKGKQLGRKKDENERPREYVAHYRVHRTLRNLVKRVGAHIGEVDRIRGVMGAAAEKAAVALTEVLDRRTREKMDAQEIRAIGDVAIKTLTVCGLSLEQKGGGTHVHVTNSFGQKIPETELEKTRQEREALHQELLAKRGGVSLGRPEDN